MKAALRRISVGDLIHAKGAQGATLICLVLDRQDGVIFTRSVTTHSYIEFSDQTGEGLAKDSSVKYQIRCIEEMPSDIRKIFLDMDWKFDPKNLTVVIEKKMMALTREQRVAILYASLHVKHFHLHPDSSD